MRPAEVLRLQMDLALRLQGDGSALAHYLNGVISDRMDEEVKVSAFVANHVRVATAYQVAGDMVWGVMHRAQTPDIAPLLPGIFQIGRDIMPPRPCGFVVLDEPWRFADINDVKQFAHMVTWGPSQVQYPDKTTAHGFLVTLWNDIVLEPDETAEEIDSEHHRELFGRWSPVGVNWLAHGMRIGPTWVEPHPRQIARAEAEGRQLNMQNLNTTRLIAALWQMFEETIGDHSVERVDRATRRGAERLKIEPQVTVITLRHQQRPVEHPGTGTPLEYRVPVEQHTRTYWTGPGRTVPVKRVIGSHWRGPEDAPIRVRPKLNRLSR